MSAEILEGNLEHLCKLGSDMVSLQEMYNIFWNDDAYLDFRSKYNLLPKKSLDELIMECDIEWSSTNNPLIFRHIVAEYVYAQDEDSELMNEFFYKHPGIPVDIIELWVKPLTWTRNNNYINDMVIEGRIAIEKYNSFRYSTIYHKLERKKEMTALDFADNLYVCDDECPADGEIKGLHYWEYITKDYDFLYTEALKGKPYTDENYLKVKSYDAAYLRDNLKIIAEHRGGKRAAELLRMLQKEWPQIKIWQASYLTMTEQDIAQFENGLYHGFDDLLKVWEKKKHKEPDSASFESLLLCPQKDKPKIMKRLHELLDNKKGKNVALVLAAAKHKHGLLLDYPTESQYKSEFVLDGAWRSVTIFIDKHTLSNGSFNINLDHIEI